MTHKDGVLPIAKPAKRGKAARRPLKAVSDKRAASGEPTGPKRTELSRVSDRRREEKPKATSTLNRATPLGHASKEQKAKVEREGPRLIVKESVYFDHAEMIAHLDPAHVTPRGIGGCDHEDCIVPLTRPQHERYDRGELDLLPYLTLDEQAHAASHLGLLGALKRTTGENYLPESQAVVV